MRSKIAGRSESVLHIDNTEFIHHKYYSPENKLEESFTSQACFRHSIAENKGVFVATIDRYTKIFAIKFTPGKSEFPFISHINNCLYKNGYIFLGTDTKEQAFFMPVL